MRLRPLVVASLLAPLALASVSTDAYAYCRTRTDPAKNDDCASQGPSLFWRNACVGYSVNKAASKKADLARARALVGGAFGAWTDRNNVCLPGVRALEQPPTDTNDVGVKQGEVNENVVVFRDDFWPYNDGGNPLALTTVTFNAATGEIYDADIEVNTADRAVTAAEPLPISGYDLQSIITHEVGHFLGLAHSRVSGATMEARYDHGDTGLRTLEIDDQRGICAIYPSDDTRTTDLPGQVTPTLMPAGPCDPNVSIPPATPPDSDGCACAESPRNASSSEALFAVLGGLAVAIRSRRRRAPRP